MMIRKSDDKMSFRKNNVFKICHPFGKQYCTMFGSLIIKS